MKPQTCFPCFFSASVDRRVLCQTSWATGCFAGREGEGRSTHPNNSSTAFSSIVEPQKVTQLNSEVRTLDKNGNTSGENTWSFISAEVVVLSGLQHPSGVGQRLPSAAVCCGLWLHAGLPEDDWWAGDTWSPCRTLSGLGAPAASEKKAAALSDRSVDQPWH